MTKTLLKCHNALSRFSIKIGFVGELLILATGAMICADVILRYLFNKPIVGTYDICCLVLSIITFLGWNIVQGEHKHINVTILMDRMPEKVRLIVLGVMNVMTTVACALMCIGTTAQAVKLTQQKFWSAIIEIPYYPFYFFAGFCFLIFTLMLLTDTLMYFIALKDAGLREEVLTWHGGSTD